MRTVVGLFKNVGDAKSTFAEFGQLGLTPQQISLVTEGTANGLAGANGGSLDATGPLRQYLAQDPSSKGAGIGAALMKMGLSQTEALRCAEGVKSGGTLEAVTVDDDKAGNALEIMRRHAGSFERAPSQKATSDDLYVPIVEEELRVGKRQVDAGGLRVSTHVTSRPIEQSVTVREEHVKIERRVVDRPVNGADAFRDSSIELMAMAEEPVVEKRAHIVEEIHIHKDIQERTETIRDKVRRTEVDIAEMKPKHDEFDTPQKKP